MYAEYQHTDNIEDRIQKAAAAEPAPPVPAKMYRS